MHEYAVTKGLIAIAVEEARKAGASKITLIRLVIGDLSTVIDESVQMYFDMLSEGTVAHGSKLEFRRVSARFHCKDCGIEFEKPKIGFDCPKCGKMGMLTDSGKEFYIESMEIE
ncbi:hydrogenase maturation nickel metallochaperone HypA [Pseudobacteroides cellulosolvens]|uniref:Hydrogenase maturation factor HypA n=1 Tax=Pseudobacteroides cellulosolvens ATCC 35603 = DSM 2933 TaxID=398512 RepID=A0A0L6JV20_9FIRM|nr:hydrogenase maturation nickel metallochaperone HypA [Pseudobacteroides cellulosolvens]KNY29678.1 hydrogenase nickel incorporation protein hypA [Pseudobacteroides cellulosolvens ATCC 35603 = DSM 2933]